MMQRSLTLLTLYLCCMLILNACVPLEPGGSSTGSTSSRLQMVDRTYSSGIHSVQLYPNTSQPDASLYPAVTAVGRSGLLLEFDDLQPDFVQYHVQLIHCNWDWQKSNLTSLQYLYDYNEFPINNYDFSQNTRIPYVHYRFEVPRVKIPGNYILSVYRNNNPSDVVLSRRFMVYDNKVGIAYEQTLPAGGVERRENQQIDFTLNYGRMGDVIDPANRIKVVIRQNQRWDNAIADLRPTSIMEGLQQMEYRPFDQSNQFKGGNEYRFFDLRTVRARGQNVGTVRRETNKVEAFLVPSPSRGDRAYSQIPDINGEYQLTNLEFPDPEISSEYVEVHFMLEADAPRNEAVYVAGEFSNYRIEEPYIMRYDAEAGGYLADILLKQGWYNHLFLLNSATEPYAFENSFAETENQYEIIVYYRPAGEIYDAIVGYTTFNSRSR